MNNKFDKIYKNMIFEYNNQNIIAEDKDDNKIMYHFSNNVRVRYGINVTDLIMPLTKFVDLDKMFENFDSKHFTDGCANYLKMIYENGKVWVLYTYSGENNDARENPDQEAIVNSVGDFILWDVINNDIEDETPYMNVYEEVIKKYNHQMNEFEDLEDLIGFIQSEVLDKNAFDVFVISK